MRGELAIATPAWDIAANAPRISPLRGQLPPMGKPLLAASKKFLLDNLAKLVYPKFD